jgi:hypothetical protein
MHVIPALRREEGRKVVSLSRTENKKSRSKANIYDRT